MRAIITGDWHCQKGLKVDVLVNFLETLKNYYLENDIDYIFVDGDVFEKSSNIKNEAFIPLFMKLMSMHNLGIKFKFIVGNHDIMNVDNDSIVETFSAFGPVYKKMYKEDIDGHEFTFLPYTKSPEDIPNSGEYLITHLSIADFKFDNAYHATEKHAIPRASFEAWSQVFTGHFHRHQQWKNICYVGSPFQMNVGEANQKKGFIILDTDRESWEFIEYVGAPVYKVLTEEDLVNLATMDFTNTMAVVKVSRKIKDFAKLRYLLYEKGAIDIIPSFEKAEEDAVSVDTDVEVKADVVDITRDFIANIEDDEIDKEYLLKVFDEVILAKV